MFHRHFRKSRRIRDRSDAGVGEGVGICVHRLAARGYLVDQNSLTFAFRYTGKAPAAPLSPSTGASATVQCN